MEKLNNDDLYFVDFSFDEVDEDIKKVAGDILVSTIENCCDKFEKEEVFSLFDLSSSQKKIYKNCKTDVQKAGFILRLNSKQELINNIFNNMIRDQFLEKYPKMFLKDPEARSEALINYFKPKISRANKTIEELDDKYQKDSKLFVSLMTIFLHKKDELTFYKDCSIALRDSEIQLEKKKNTLLKQHSDNIIRDVEKDQSTNNSKKNQKLNEANQKLNKENKEIKDKYETLSTENKELKESLEALKQVNTSKDNQIIELKNQNNELNDELDDLNNNPGIRKVRVNKLDSSEIKEEKDFVNAILENSKALHLDYSFLDIANFHIALKTSQLVILAGSSGTGKTQLPIVYSKTLNMTEENKHLLFIPISPAYTEPSDILGYLKPNINSEKTIVNGKEVIYDGTFIESQTGLVEFLIEADKHKDELYMVVFDEMNLSQIEYWFSPFMSILERNDEDRKITLYSNTINCSNGDKIKSSINVGNNIVFVGTINLDETTKELSDRLIDRAIIVNLESKKVEDYFSSMSQQPKNKRINSYESDLFFNFRLLEDNYITIFNKDEIDFFKDLSDYINKTNNQKELSFRTLKNIANYLNNSNGLLTREEAFDIAIKETIIMKIKGSDNSIRVMLGDEGGLKDVLDNNQNISRFERTREAINKKLNELTIYGYTR